MVRQARSEATRQRIVNAAVELFSEVGDQATGLGDIIERAQLTKGALYYHFDSKEALATAIIEEGADIALRAFRSISDPSSPALENMIQRGNRAHPRPPAVRDGCAGQAGDRRGRRA